MFIRYAFPVEIKKATMTNTHKKQQTNSEGHLKEEK
jgi:hypothetical protein